MAVVVPLTWAMGLVFTKGAISDFPPILLMAFRFLLTALILVAFAPLPRGNFLNLFLIAIVGAAGTHTHGRTLTTYATHVYTYTWR